MKYRIGFVTNSSSSSYLCVICDKSHAGYDATLNDAEMVECQHGHMFCTRHISDKNIVNLTIATIKEDIEWMKAYNYHCAEEENILDEIINAPEENKATLARMALTDSSLEINSRIPEAYCPICTFDYLTNDVIAQYLVAKYALNRTDIRKELQTTFGSHSEFLAKTKSDE